jgi:hypothetical protein
MKASILLIRILLFFSCLALPQASSQVEEASALIDFLANRTDRPDKAAIEVGVFSCGQVAANLEAACKLADLGQPAVPRIEAELDVIEAYRDRWEYGANWIALALARIKGSGAYPRLRKLNHGVILDGERQNFDDAIALSLGITSYVSASRGTAKRIDCGRALEPRHTLDQLILGWLRGDRSLFESNLGPNGRIALGSLLGDHTWEKMHSAGLGKGGGIDEAIGYRLNIDGKWSEPPEPLRRNRVLEDPSTFNGQNKFLIDTTFVGRTGKICGGLKVTFLRIYGTIDREIRPYQIDNVNIGSLLSTLRACRTSSL